MTDRVDMQKFYDCLYAKMEKRGKSTIAKGIGISPSVLQGLLDGEFRKGLFELNSNVCGAFFSACVWLGVPARTFLIEDTEVTQNTGETWKTKKLQ